ncbi:hypothetical protein GMORB2_5260 [Geosmithia morbida]|uniref:Uncharacterized protein n=1 Tax=Geosmithia morbida TaxID=1094350 RepID=A0A9P5D7K6_9HYPO|nr:uncharacterized protein GMORB2_5260 [Geosmithia morbida]KAF4124594.1 hypothetical protein GMORB2_5260 [Geosmithia morbida]
MDSESFTVSASSSGLRVFVKPTVDSLAATPDWLATASDGD